MAANAWWIAKQTEIDAADNPQMTTAEAFIAASEHVPFTAANVVSGDFGRTMEEFRPALTVERVLRQERQEEVRRRVKREMATPIAQERTTAHQATAFLDLVRPSLRPMSFQEVEDLLGKCSKWMPGSIDDIDEGTVDEVWKAIGKTGKSH